MNFVIIGGMAAGCRAGTRLKRIKPEANVTIIDKMPFVSFGACGMPFFASGDVDSFTDLASTPWGVIRNEEFFRNVKDIEVVINTQAERIDTEQKVVFAKNVRSGVGSEYPYDQLLIATGAKALGAPFPCPESENISTFHNPLDSKQFRIKAQTGQVGSAVIIGGGYIGCELAEAMVSLWGIETHLIEREDRLLPRCTDKEISRILEKEFLENDINLHLSTTVEKIELGEKGNPLVFLSDGTNIETDYAFLCLGIRPQTELAKQIGCEIGDSGGIIVDNRMQTNVPNVFAAGDCCEIKNMITDKGELFPLGSLANRQGRVIANNISGRESEFPGAVGTISIKTFDLVMAACGVNEQQAKINDMDYGVVCGSWYDRPEYHPEHKILFAKMLYEKKTLRLLGLQLACKGEATRYIDAFSIFASKKATAYDLLDFEHAYTPSHSSPMNMLNDIGSMAIAQEEDGIICISPDSPDFGKYSVQLLDLREESEVEAISFPEESIHLPTGIYRSQIDKLEKDKPVLAACQKGPRSYEGARVLKGQGFRDVAYLGGGIQMREAIGDPDV